MTNQDPNQYTPDNNQAAFPNNDPVDYNQDAGYTDGAVASGRKEKPKVKRSIAGSTWVALIIGALLLILLLVFIIQNQENVQLQLFGMEMTFPIGAGMLIAALVGALIMALVGGVRIMQLRRQVTHR